MRGFQEDQREQMPGIIGVGQHESMRCESMRQLSPERQARQQPEAVWTALESASQWYPGSPLQPEHGWQCGQHEARLHSNGAGGRLHGGPGREGQEPNCDV